MWEISLVVSLLLLFIVLWVLSQVSQRCQPCSAENRSAGGTTPIDELQSQSRPLTGTYNSDHLVVGPIIDENSLTAPPTDYGRTDLPVEYNTVLQEETPPDVQMELLAGTPVKPLTAGALRAITLPGTFDARQKWPGLITEPYHQGSCGSCWAFSSALAVTDRIRINDPTNEELRTRFIYRPFWPNTQYPVTNALSPYELVNCDTCSSTRETFPLANQYLEGPACDQGCSGGLLPVVYNYMMTRGLTTLLASPPTCDPLVQACPCRRGENARVYRPRRVYALVSPGQSNEVTRQKMMEDLFQHGPLTIGFIVYQSWQDFFRTNPRGVYTNAARTRNDRKIGGHAVDVVGWGTDQQTGTFYWLCRNSYGPGWGDQGYFKIQYDFEGIMSNAMGCEI